jgi:hypothetical protein
MKGHTKERKRNEVDKKEEGTIEKRRESEREK